MATMASAPSPAAAIVMPASVTPPMAAMVTVARSAVVAEAKIQFHRRADIGGIATTIIRVVAGVRRSVYRTAAKSCGQQESGRTSFQYTYASSSHLSPLRVNLISV